MGDTKTGENEPQRFQLPADLTGLSVDQLADLEKAAQAEFKTVRHEFDKAPDAATKAVHLKRADELATALGKLTGRVEAVKAEAADIQAQFDGIVAKIRPAAATEPTGEPVVSPADSTPPAPAVPADAPASPVEAGKELAPVGGATTASRDIGGLTGPQYQLNPSLSAIRRTAPPQAPPTPPLAITASVRMPGRFEPGDQIGQLGHLTELIENRAKGMSVGHGTDRSGLMVRDRTGGYRGMLVDAFGGVQVASVARQWADGPLSDASPIAEIEEYRRKIAGKARPDAFQAMVAGGGWCAMGEPIWNFFDVTCQGGMIDLPTRGITRGGIIVPTSPTVADAYTPDLGLYEATFSNATVPWLWTEEDDILTVTGSTNKPCLRVPCAAMTSYRLECYGVCITAGNLADNAWPESTANFLRLINNVHYHASNARYIAQIVTLAGAAITAGVACTGGGRGTAAPLLGVLELGAVDYRARFGACPDDVIEIILPTWAKTAVRIDLSKRTGVSDFMCVTDQMISNWFSCRNLRVQFVEDWQVRAAGQPGASTPVTALPSSVQALMYFPGAIVRGNGMSLNLGVVRDSTLNAENDHTALWMEECHLIAQFGPAPRLYTIEICADGTTGAADITSCCVH